MPSLECVAIENKEYTFSTKKVGLCKVSMDNFIGHISSRHLVYLHEVVHLVIGLQSSTPGRIAIEHNTVSIIDETRAITRKTLCGTF